MERAGVKKEEFRRQGFNAIALITQDDSGKFTFINLYREMEIRTDVHADAARIQNEIKTHLGLKSSELIFEYSTLDGSRCKLDLITINPRHSQSFLFRTEVGLNKVDALTKMLDYVQNYREKEYSYTIQWIAKENRELQTSYFRARNMYDALDKLYYGRDINTITVYSCVLNPMT